MKKMYESPMATWSVLNAEDILTTSGDSDNIVSLPNLPGWPGKL